MFATVLAGFCLLFAVSLSFGDQKGDEALSRLLDGNKRFVSGNLAKKNAVAAHPWAIAVTCSDSTAAPEIIFDQGLGDLFTVRVAGNVLDPISVGSIDYALTRLHPALLLLLGHDRCDVVSAALEAKDTTGDNTAALFRKILPAARKATSKGGTKEVILSNAVKENVLLQQKYLIRKSTVVRNLIASGALKLVTAIYHDDSGKVEIFGN